MVTDAGILEVGERAIVMFGIGKGFGYRLVTKA
jgi:hypothetical protein